MFIWKSKLIKKIGENLYMYDKYIIFTKFRPKIQFRSGSNEI